MATAPDQTSVYGSMNPNLALITRYAWPLDPAGHPYGGGGVRMLPRDFMKLGQLMLEGGTWNGHHILSHDFADRASTPLHDLNGIQYGYLWWNIMVRAGEVHGFLGPNGSGMTAVTPYLFTLG